nr:monovalent cation/H(+) antiporter subunit G [Ornithinimicrobium sp. F0845]
MITDSIGLVLILAGAVLCLTAAIGLLRFNDLLTRMHAATKPQVLGVLLVLCGVALSKEGGLHIGMLLLVGIFQMLTIPVGAHMVGRAGFRTGQVAPSDIHLGPSSDHVAAAEAAGMPVQGEGGRDGGPGGADADEISAGSGFHDEDHSGTFDEDGERPLS